MDLTHRFAALSMPTCDNSGPRDFTPRPKSAGEHIIARPEPILNYTIVALVGMLAGFILGCLFTRADGDAAVDQRGYRPVPRPRALESQPTP